MMRAVQAFAGIALVVLCLSLIGFGQTTNATIMGRVLDPSKAAVVGADVQATNVDTGTTNRSVTNGTGLFSIPNVSPGNYRISVTKPGFRSIVKPDVILHLQEVIALNFDLPVGSASEVITVTAGASIVNTTDASVSTVIDQTYVANMPLNGRSFQDLILLTPGVVTNTPQRSSTLGMDGEFSVNGQRTEANYYTVDGVSANVGTSADPNISFYGTTDGSGASGSVAAATASGTTQALVSVDDLQEFRVQSSTYSAQYGRSPGGQFAFETKSGTNQIHGTAYEYLRNDIFDSTDYFTNYLRTNDPTIKKTATRQNDFGGTLGGPVRIPRLYNGKDKTFFFVSFEGLRLVAPQPATTSFVPDLCMRGDASQCPAGRAPGAAELQPVLKSYPLPTVNGFDPVDGVGEFTSGWSNPSSINSTSVRFDHSINDNWKLFFRFSNTTSEAVTRGGPPGFPLAPTLVATNAYTMRTYTTGVNSVFTNRISNEFRLNYTSNVTDGTDDIQPFGGSTPVDLAQLTGLSGFSRPSVAPLFFLGPYFFEQQTILLQGAQKQWNLADTVSIAAGSHRLSFGVDYRRLAPYALPSTPGILYFYGDEPSVESNFAFESAQAFAPAHPLYKNFSLFAEDEWRASQRLSLSLGLRWEVDPPPGVTEGLMPYTIAFQPDPNNWTLAPQGTPLWKTTWLNFAPRIGGAYLLRNSSSWETVLRGGAGVFFDTGQQTGSQGFEGPGFSATDNSLAGPFPGNPATQIPQITNPPTGTNVSVWGFYPNLQLPFTIQWNASIQQALGRSQALTISYVASHAAKLLQISQFKSSLAINPINVTQNGKTSDYNALQLQFQRRLSHGLTALASYTWSHCIDFGSRNIKFGYEEGSCDFDVRHNFSAAISYDLPNVGHGKFAGALLNHWGIDPRVIARTAFPVDLSGGDVFDPLTRRRVSNGLDFVPDKPIYIYGAQCNAVYATDFPPPLGVTALPCPGGRAINPDAFQSVSSGLGNVPRNFARGFGAWQVNMAVRREFPIRENLKLQFRAEAFNIFNHTNLGLINSAHGQATFGQATATLANSLGVLNQLYEMGGPRSMQFALRLVF
jgi:hypothetical protein